MKKTLILFLLGLIVLSATQIALARDETVGQVYHFIFRLEKDVSGSDNQAIMNGFKTKMEALGIISYNIQTDKDMFILTVKTHSNPQTILAAIESDKKILPIKLLTYFLCEAPVNRQESLTGGY